MSKLPIPYRLFIDDIRDQYALALEQGRELKDQPARIVQANEFREAHYVRVQVTVFFPFRFTRSDVAVKREQVGARYSHRTRSPLCQSTCRAPAFARPSPHRNRFHG